MPCMHDSNFQLPAEASKVSGTEAVVSGTKVVVAYSKILSSFSQMNTPPDSYAS